MLLLSILVNNYFVIIVMDCAVSIDNRIYTATIILGCSQKTNSGRCTKFPGGPECYTHLFREFGQEKRVLALLFFLCKIQHLMIWCINTYYNAVLGRSLICLNRLEFALKLYDVQMGGAGKFLGGAAPPGHSLATSLIMLM